MSICRKPSIPHFALWKLCHMFNKPFTHSDRRKGNCQSEAPLHSTWFEWVDGNCVFIGVTLAQSHYHRCTLSDCRISDVPQALRPRQQVFALKTVVKVSPAAWASVAPLCVVLSGSFSLLALNPEDMQTASVVAQAVLRPRLSWH